MFCPNSTICHEAYINCSAHLFETPLRHFPYDIAPRKPENNIILPEDIRILPPALYEDILYQSTPYSNTSALELAEVMVQPMTYWRTTSPVLGFMGSLTVF